VGAVAPPRNSVGEDIGAVSARVSRYAFAEASFPGPQMTASAFTSCECRDFRPATRTSGDPGVTASQVAMGASLPLTARMPT
jgi:hypothetical protein